MQGSKAYLNGLETTDPTTGNRTKWNGVVYVLDQQAMKSLIKSY